MIKFINHLKSFLFLLINNKNFFLDEFIVMSEFVCFFRCLLRLLMQEPDIKLMI